MVACGGEIRGGQPQPSARPVPRCSLRYRAFSFRKTLAGGKELGMKINACKVTVFFLFGLLASSLVAQDTCPYPVYKSLSCDDGQGCKQTRVVSDCSGPKSANKCQLGGYTILCCGEPLSFAESVGPCSGNGGPSPALLKELKSQPLIIRARLYLPSCGGSFEPLMRAASAVGVRNQ